MGSTQLSRRPNTSATRVLLGACAGGLVLMVVLGTLVPRKVDALPAGKAWSAVIDTLKLQGHTFGIVPSRLEPDSLGRPLAFVEALGGIGQDMYVLRWEDSTWISVDHLGYGTKGVRPVPSPSGTHHLIWSGLEEIDPLVQSYLVMNEFAGDTLGRPDTVATIYAGSLKYAAAATHVRRWAAAEDNFDLRLLYSDATGPWVEVPVGGKGDRSVALAALDDTTALMVWRDMFAGPGAGVLAGSIWTTSPAPPMNGLLDAGPRLRPRPSGGHWLSWATIDDYVGVASYRDGVWSPPESLFCAYLRPEAHYAQSSAAMSRDDGEYPAISWMAVSSVNLLTSVCVCVPGDSGFTMAENLAGSEDGGVPLVARDRNQDVWVVWEAPAKGMAWAHTYTRATSSTPSVTSVRGKRTVAWWLSEPAPGSWWAVLRARAGEPFEEVARVRAGQGQAMTWDDLSATGVYRYRIRRECMDRQYQWLSDEGRWPVDVPPGFPGTELALYRTSSNPSDALIRFEVLNASAGPLDVQVYDVRGRLLLRQRPTADGNGLDSILIDLTSSSTRSATGLYFLRVADASGKVSPSAKIIYLR